MRAARRVRVRIVGDALPGRVCGAYTGVTVALQVGKEAAGRVPGDAARAEWEAEIELAHDDEAWTFRGKAVHGPKGDRFFYLVWASQVDGEDTMFRRAKLMLRAVTADVLEAAWEGGALTARLPLTDERGMPRCAAVRPPLVAWTA